MSHVRMILHHFDPHHPRLGGIDTCIRDLVRYGRNQRFLLVATTLGRCKPFGRRWGPVSLEDRDVESVCVAAMPRSRSRIPNVVRYAFGVWRHRHVVRERRPDVVQVHRAELVWLVRKVVPDVPVHLFLHEDAHGWTSSTTESRWRRLAPFYRLLVARAVARSERVVCFSPSASERLVGRHPNVVASPTWFDPERFRLSPRASNSGGRLLWVGRLETVKDPFLAIRVMEALPPEYELTMVGDGALREALEAALGASPAEGRIRFLGTVDKDRVATLMRSHDTLLMTSHSEGFPRVMVEALATGRTVVATPEADTARLLVAGVNGARATSRQPHELARLVLDARSIGPESCRQTVADLTAPRVVSGILAPLRG